jgi:Fe-S cluster assembly iron-binding protein IscA
MKFTPEAQALIKQMMKDNNLDVLSVRVIFNETEEGMLQLDLLSKEECADRRIVEMDSISVAIDEAEDFALEDTIFDAQGDEIVVEFPHHHHHDGECCGHHHHEEGHCCGHHHHHEGECCCGDDCECECEDKAE